MTTTLEIRRRLRGGSGIVGRDAQDGGDGWRVAGEEDDGGGGRGDGGDWRNSLVGSATSGWSSCGPGCCSSSRGGGVVVVGMLVDVVVVVGGMVVWGGREERLEGVYCCCWGGVRVVVIVSRGVVVRQLEEIFRGTSDWDFTVFLKPCVCACVYVDRAKSYLSVAVGTASVGLGKGVA